MMNEKNVHLLIVIAFAIALFAISAGSAWWYIAKYHIPMRHARPILEKLSTENPQEIQKAAFLLEGYEFEVTESGKVKGKVRRTEDMKEHHPLVGIAAKRVERKILEILPKIEDQNALDGMLSVIWPSGRTGLDFSRYGEEEWGIISDAANKHDPKAHSGNHYKVEYRDGRHVLVLEGGRSF